MGKVGSDFSEGGEAALRHLRGCGMVRCREQQQRLAWGMAAVQARPSSVVQGCGVDSGAARIASTIDSGTPWRQSAEIEGSGGRMAAPQIATAHHHRPIMTTRMRSPRLIDGYLPQLLAKTVKTTGIFPPKRPQYTSTDT